MPSPTELPTRSADRPSAETAYTPPVPTTAMRGLTAEWPVYVPGVPIDAAPLGETRPARGLRPRRRPRLHHVLIGLSGGTLLLIVLGVLGLATVLSPLGARRVARIAAERELGSELEPGEHVFARVSVSQRLWADNLRESFGVLAATNRKLLYVGVPPRPWLGGPTDGPPELRVQTFPYDVPFTADARRLLFGTTPGVIVRTPAADVAFLVPRGERAQARDIERVVERALVARTAAREREQQARVTPIAPPTVYGTYVVRSGDAVTTIARHFGTTPDVIRQLNRLSTDRIRIGGRLRVPIPADSALATSGVPAAVPGGGARPVPTAY